MQSKYVDFNITKTIFPAPQMDSVRGDIACCCVPCSPIICRINAELTAVTPPPTLQSLSNAFHNMVTAVMAVPYSSRPRALRLAQSITSRAICVVASGSAWCLLCLSTVPSLFFPFVQYGNFPMKPARSFRLCTSLSLPIFDGMSKWRGINFIWTSQLYQRNCE